MFNWYVRLWCGSRNSNFSLPVYQTTGPQKQGAEQFGSNNPPTCHLRHHQVNILLCPYFPSASAVLCV